MTASITRTFKKAGGPQKKRRTPFSIRLYDEECEQLNATRAIRLERETLLAGHIGGIRAAASESGRMRGTAGSLRGRAGHARAVDRGY